MGSQFGCPTSSAKTSRTSAGPACQSCLSAGSPPPKARPVLRPISRWLRLGRCLRRDGSRLPASEAFRQMYPLQLPRARLPLLFHLVLTCPCWSQSKLQTHSKEVLSNVLASARSAVWRLGLVSAPAPILPGERVGASNPGVRAGVCGWGRRRPAASARARRLLFVVSLLLCDNEEASTSAGWYRGLPCRRELQAGRHRAPTTWSFLAAMLWDKSLEWTAPCTREVRYIEVAEALERDT